MLHVSNLIFKILYVTLKIHQYSRYERVFQDGIVAGRLFCLVPSRVYIDFSVYISYIFFIFLISISIYGLNILSCNPPHPMWYGSAIFIYFRTGTPIIS
jgi:hypothetical protein